MWMLGTAPHSLAPRPGRRLRLGLFGLATAALATLVVADTAEATLKKYFLQRVSVTDRPGVSPRPDFLVYISDAPADPRNPPDLTRVGRGSSVLIDTDSEPNPVLKKLLLVTARGTTTDVPGLAGAIFTNNRNRRGPTGEFTGTGTTTTSISWGVTTGWTITGTFWCNSVPSFICSLAMGMDETSNEPRFNSDFYDLGTWFFHATGFTAVPYVDNYSTTNFGNNYLIYLGREFSIPATPALPLMGIGLLGVSLVLGGAVALRRMKE